MDDAEKPQTVEVPVWLPGQLLRHVPDGKAGVLERHHSVHAGWVVVRTGDPRSPYHMETPASEWEINGPLLTVMSKERQKPGG
jgi:hypothetical protein